MKKVWCFLAMVVITQIALPVWAQEDAPTTAPANAPTTEQDGHPKFLLLQDKGATFFGIAIGTGLIVFGGAAGIGRIGASATESMARQPEAAGSINGMALITAAMIEGSVLFAIVVCLLAVFKA